MSTTQIAPLPKLRFVDGNGNALSGGKLFTYSAGTTTKLATYADQSGNTANTNPIILDSRGECNCWFSPGVLYKLVLSPSTDTDPPTNPIWTVDNLSSGISLPVEPSQGGTPFFYGGATTGSGTAQTLATVTPSNFTLVSGYRVGFTAGATNTGDMTLDVASTGAVHLRARTPGGLVALSGGEIVQGCAYTVEYDGTYYQILDATSETVPPGALLPYAGSTAPAGWMLCYGQAVSRISYAALFAIIGTTYGSGDGSTTFNLPDLRGRVVAGVDNMGGSAASRITNAVSGITGTTLGAAGGDQSMQQHTHTATVSGAPSVTLYNTSSGGSGAYTSSGSGSGTTTAANATAGTLAVTNANNGAGSSQNLQPTMMLNYIIKS